MTVASRAVSVLSLASNNAALIIGEKCLLFVNSREQLCGDGGAAQPVVVSAAHGFYGRPRFRAAAQDVAKRADEAVHAVPPGVAADEGLQAGDIRLRELVLFGMQVVRRDVVHFAVRAGPAGVDKGPVHRPPFVCTEIGFAYLAPLRRGDAEKGEAVFHVGGHLCRFLRYGNGAQGGEDGWGVHGFIRVRVFRR